ncbi:hypothetical protein GCM10007147_34320 [Nocardiopsis kunsanensis]|uniref:Uncharacterized protein n=1 Tax=Nocardiopsis kunsanensis TaxID=141693 RepID=A0A918XGY1_9ACTN|nr:hypothetical protein GCM10007147_34320 [Nocardiopsis kunsanensis]
MGAVPWIVSVTRAGAPLTRAGTALPDVRDRQAEPGRYADPHKLPDGPPGPARNEEEQWWK